MKELIHDLRRLIVKYDPDLTAEEREFLIGEFGLELPVPPEEGPVYREDGFSEETSFLGARRHILIDQAVEELVERAEAGEPYAAEALAQVRWWTIISFDAFPELKPDDPDELKRATAGLNGNFSLAIIGVRSYDYRADRAREEYGILDLDDAPEGEGPERTRTYYARPKENLTAWASRVANAIRRYPERLAELERQRQEDEDNDVQRPKPGPRP